MLTIALLWYDDDARRPLPQKILDATARYRERLGAAPTVCHLNPAQAAQAVQVSPRKKLEPLPVRLEADDTMRPNYFLIGLDDQDAPDQPIPAASSFFEDEETEREARRVQAAPAAASRKRAPRRATTQPEPAPARSVAKRPAAVAQPEKVTSRAAKPRAAVKPGKDASPVRARRQVTQAKPIATAEPATSAKPRAQKKSVATVKPIVSAKVRKVAPTATSMKPANNNLPIKDARPAHKSKLSAAPAPEPAARRHAVQRSASSQSGDASAPVKPTPRSRAIKRLAAESAPIAFQPTLLDSSSAQTQSARKPAPRGRTRRAS
jgi:hypothetical protein